MMVMLVLMIMTAALAVLIMIVMMMVVMMLMLLFKLVELVKALNKHYVLVAVVEVKQIFLLLKRIIALFLYVVKVGFLREYLAVVGH